MRLLIRILCRSQIWRECRSRSHSDILTSDNNPQIKPLPGPCPSSANERTLVWHCDQSEAAIIKIIKPLPDEVRSLPGARDQRILGHNDVRAWRLYNLYVSVTSSNKNTKRKNVVRRRMSMMIPWQGSQTISSLIWVNIDRHFNYNGIAITRDASLVLGSQ